MSKHLVIPKISLWLVWLLIAIEGVELFGFGVGESITAFWVVLIAAFFLTAFSALFRHDSLPLIFTTLYLTAYHALVLYINVNLPLAVVFLVIFAANAALVWLLLHYATHLPPPQHLAYGMIGGFLNAQVVLVFALMARDWNFSFETASVITAVLTYTYWRLACLQADGVISLRHVLRLGALAAIVIVLAVITSPSVII